jgi:hypothetical protein
VAAITALTQTLLPAQVRLPAGKALQVEAEYKTDLVVASLAVVAVLVKRV